MQGAAQHIADTLSRALGLQIPQRRVQTAEGTEEVRSVEFVLRLDHPIDQCVDPPQVVEAMYAGGFDAARSKLVVPGAFCEYIGSKS